MSENAEEEIKEFLSLYNQLQNGIALTTTTQMQCLAKSLAMQQAGVIQMDNDPDRIYREIKDMETASLR